MQCLFPLSIFSNTKWCSTISGLLLSCMYCLHLTAFLNRLIALNQHLLCVVWTWIKKEKNKSECAEQMHFFHWHWHLATNSCLSFITYPKGGEDIWAFSTFLLREDSREHHVHCMLEWMLYSEKTLHCMQALDTFSESAHIWPEIRKSYISAMQHACYSQMRIYKVCIFPLIPTAFIRHLIFLCIFFLSCASDCSPLSSLVFLLSTKSLCFLPGINLSFNLHVLNVYLCGCLRVSLCTCISDQSC